MNPIVVGKPFCGITCKVLGHSFEFLNKVKTPFKALFILPWAGSGSVAKKVILYLSQIFVSQISFKVLYNLQSMCGMDIFPVLHYNTVCCMILL